MAITLTDLAIRSLRFMGVIGADETPSAEDMTTALEGVRDAHSYLKVEDLVQWTLNDIPDYAEKPYIMIAAWQSAPEFTVLRDDNWIAQGTIQLRRALNLRASGRTQAEYF